LASEGDAATEGLLKRRDAIRTELEANKFNEDLFAALTGAANLALDIASSEKTLLQTRGEEKGLRQLVQARGAEASAAAQGVEKAAKELAAAETTLAEAKRHDLAAALRSGLKAGDPCPVCGGKIGTLTAEAPPELDAATTRHIAARTAHDKAAAAASKAAQDAAVAEANLGAASKRLAELMERLDGQRTRLTEALPGIEDRSLATVQAMLALQKEARDERAHLQKEAAAAEKQIEDAKRRLEAAKADLEALKARIATDTEAAETARAAVAATGRDLTKVAKELEWRELQEALAATKDPRPAIDQRLHATRALHDQANRSIGAIETAIKALAGDIERAKELRAALQERTKDHALAADLSAQLRADRFQAFIQAEALRELAKEGSRRLQQLSNDRYELAVTDGGQDFEVIDRWNAEDRRSVRTLSGGETFLASLALALSLAESLPLLAPGRAVSLDSIFLDEGFGSLDPEALGLAANALDSLSVEGRLICVVTHLEELAERLPARLKVHKAETGSRVDVA
jgi:exonuclease SbcC